MNPKKKLRIAQIVSLEENVPPKSQNGLEFVASWLTEGLVKRGHDVTLFAPDASVTSAKHVSILPEALWGDPKSVWWKPVRSTWNTTVAAMRAKEFDVIHSHTWSIVFAAPFIQTPVVHTLHHPANHDSWCALLNSIQNKEQLAPIAQVYNAIRNVAVSKRQKELFQANGGDFFFSQIDVIHNGIPTSLFMPHYEPGEYLLYLGYITPQKGAHLAIDIARRTGKKLTIAGNYVGQEEYFAARIAPQLDDTITYVGPADFEQKTKLYQHAEALLVPLQWDEPFGLTLVEAMACGTPVIAFDRGAAKEIIEDGVTGFVCADIDEACDALVKIPAIDRKKCRERAEKYFDVEAMLDAYEALYYSILEKQK